MRIIHCAPFNLFTKTGGSLYSNPIKISLGLVKNNHFVHNFDYRDTARYYSFFKNKKRGSNKMNKNFLNLIEIINPDLIIFGHAELIEYKTFQVIKEKGIRTIFWYNDLPLPKDIKNKSKYLDIILTTAAGEILDELRTFHKKSFFMPNLIDKNIEKYKSFDNQIFKNSVLFTGRYDKEREKLVDFLKHKLNPSLPMKFVGFNKASLISGESYFQEIINTKIVLNHNRKFTTHYKWFTSDRLMHIIGNGAFTLSTPMLNNEDFFEDKLEIYNNLEELKNKIDIFLNDNQRRIENSKWLYTRSHKLFNSKRVTKYILDLFYENEKKLLQYEWFND